MLKPDFSLMCTLLQKKSWSNRDRADFVTLIENARQFCPKFYKDICLPYIKSFPHHFCYNPLYSCQELSELKAIRKNHPFAGVHLKVPQGLIQKSEEALRTEDWYALTCVVSLEFAEEMPSHELLKIFLKRFELKSLSSVSLENVKSFDLHHIEILCRTGRLKSLNLKGRHISSHFLEEFSNAKMETVILTGCRDLAVAELTSLTLNDELLYLYENKESWTAEESFVVLSNPTLTDAIQRSYSRPLPEPVPYVEIS